MTNDERIMITQLTVKVQPGQSLHLPGICAHCAQPAVEWMSMKKWNGRLFRRMDVPVCKACARHLGRRSWQEERWIKVGWALVALSAVLIFSLAFFLLFAPLPFTIRMVLALLSAALAAYDAFAFARRKGLSATVPEKKSILASARIIDFSWRTATIEFDNDSFAERFIELNKNSLV